MNSNNVIKKIKNDLHKLSDEKHKLFLKKLIPNRTNILGVKNPILLHYIKQLKYDEIIIYLEYLEYEFLEEVIMYAMILSRKKNDIYFVLKYLDNFRLMIDNWCSCDSFAYKVKNDDEKTILWNYIENNYFKSKDLYTLRLTIVIILKNFFEKKYLKSILNFIKTIDNNEYYCEMSIAWLLSQLYFVDKEIIFIFIQKHTKGFIFKKTIQKICESNKSNYDDKKKLKQLLLLK